jgi:hypothetical protein
MASKVSFDGVNRIISVLSEVTSFNIRSDLYSSWIDWLVLEDNIKFLPALRVTGLDPIGSGIFTGDVYFLINGWKLSINTQVVKTTGVLYSDNYDTPFYTVDLLPQYPITVSALVTTVSTGGSSGASASEVRQEIDSNSTRLASIQSSISTLPTTITTAIDTNSIKLAQIKSIIDSIIVPTARDTAAAVWSTPIITIADKTTIGGYITKVLLSVPKFLGLK